MNGNGTTGQLAFSDMEIRERQERARAMAEALDRAVKAAAYGVKRERLALIIDRSYSYLSEILNSNNEEGQKPFQLAMLPAVAIEAPDLFAAEVINLLCDMAGYEHPEKKRTMTAEEENVFLRRRLAAIEQAVVR